MGAPGWSEDQISGSSEAVYEHLLRHTSGGRDLARYETLCGQPSTTRAAELRKKYACSIAGGRREKYRRIARDAPRVLQLLSRERNMFLTLAGDPHRRQLYVEEMARGAVSFYVFLVTVAVQAPWATRSPGHDASVGGAWRKLGPELRLLWSPSQFQKALM